MDKKTLGDYSIIKEIGQGTLGHVYLAEHRFIKQHYVLKVLPEELATDRNFIQRFEKTVKVLAKLDHPHIVKVHNVSFAEGYYFFGDRLYCRLFWGDDQFNAVSWGE